MAVVFSLLRSPRRGPHDIRCILQFICYNKPQEEERNADVIDP